MNFPHKTALFICILMAAISAFIASFGVKSWMFLIPYLLLSYIAVQTISDLICDTRYVPKGVWIILFGLAYAVSWDSGYAKMAFATGCVFLLIDAVWVAYQVYKKAIKPRFG